MCFVVIICLAEESYIYYELFSITHFQLSPFFFFHLSYQLKTFFNFMNDMVKNYKVKNQ